MKRVLIGVWLPALLAGCTTTTDLSVYEPEASELTPEDWRTAFPIEYGDWSASVHGEAYLAGDTNAPGCTGCHDDPATADIRSAAFHLEIPARCARCHSDEEMMSPYNISADVYDTYLADYHGTTIAYYQAMDPGSLRYEAVCSAVMAAMPSMPLKTKTPQ